METTDKVPRWFHISLALIATFLLAAQLGLLAYPGLQQDEVVFAMPFLPGNTTLYSWHLGNLRIPVMLVDYLGSLKSLLYWPIFHFWPPNIWSIRLPVCALSAGTLLLFGNLVRRVAGQDIAVLACLILASDSSFLFCNVFDWGPVSLILFGTVTTLSFVQRFLVSGRIICLILAALISGLSFWYKAVFIFPLAGITGAFLLSGRQIAPPESLRRSAVALAMFAAGSSPMLIYNLTGTGATLRAASELNTVPVAEKLMMLRITLEGRALEHYMFRSFRGEDIPLQGASLSDLAMRWYSTSSTVIGSALFPALILSLLLLPFLRSSNLFRPLMFTWAALLIALLLMLVFRNAGAGPHHMVLLYPAPQFIVAATAWALGKDILHSGRFALVTVALIVASNLWLLGNYYSAARHNGFSVYWSDGLPALASAVRSRGLPVAILDWGMDNGIRIQTRGSVPIVNDSIPRRDILYISHCPGYVVDAPAVEQFDRLARLAGLVRYDAGTVRDHESTAIYCVFRLK
jgi:hypothetical protein